MAETTPAPKEKKWGARCPRCGRALPPDFESGRLRCASCGQRFDITRFVPVPLAVDRPDSVAAALDGSAPCTRHEGNVAVAACARCGTFMCALCRVETEGRSLCAPCFERVSEEEGFEGGETRFRNYAGMALLCLIVSFLCTPAASLAGIVGVVLSVKGLRDKKRRGESDGVAGLYVRMILCGLAAAAGIIYLAVIGVMFASEEGL